MKCTLSLNAPNGNKSILFKDIMKSSGNHEDAIDTYYFTKTEEFKEFYGDWENGEVSPDKLDLNGEPKYSSFSTQKFIQEADLANVTLPRESQTYKDIMNQVPLVLSRLDQSIESASLSGKQGKLVGSLTKIRKLFEKGDVATSIPKFISISKGHIKSLRSAINNRSDIKDITYLYKEAQTYRMVLDMLGKLNEDSASADIFDETVFESEKDIRADLGAIQSMYLAASKSHLVEVFHKQDPTWSKKDIKKWLEDSPRDVKSTEYFLEYMGDSQDKVLAHTAALVMNQEHAIRKEKIAFNAKLTTMVDDILAEGKTSNAEELFADILTTRDNEIHVLDINAKFTAGKNPASDAEFAAVNKLRTSKPKLYEFLTFYSTTMKKLNASLPAKGNIGTRIPTVLKSTRDRLQGKSIKDRASLIQDEINKSIQRSNTDIERGMVLDGESKPIQQIPVFYTQAYDSVDHDRYLNEMFDKLIEEGKTEEEALPLAKKYADTEAKKDMASLVTKDLSHSLQTFHSMAINYAKKNDIIHSLEAAKTVIGSDTRKYVKLDKAGRVLKKSNKYGEDEVIRDGGSTSEALKQVTQFIDMHVYGKKETDLGYTKVAGKNVDINKGIRLVNKMTSWIQMSFNFLASTANVAVGEYNNALEAIAGEYTSLSAYKKAGKLYRQNIGGILKDIGNRASENIVNQINDHYNVLMDYDGGNARSIENSVLKRTLKSNLAFFMQGSGEHFVQSRLGLSILEATKTFDNKGNETGTLLSAHEKGNKQVKIKEGVFVKNKEGVLVPYDSREQNKVSNRIATIIRKVHGNYSSLTATAAKQDARTALILKYRDWIYEGLTRRFGSRQTNIHLEDKEVVGFYREGAKNVLNLAKDIKTLNFSLLKENWNDLSFQEKANIKRLVSEVGMIVSLAMSSLLLGKAGEWTKDEFDGDDFTDRLALGTFNFLMYETNRLTTEISAFVNPVEALRLLKSPAAATSILESSYNLLSQAFSGPFEQIEVGKYKGEYKLVRAATKLTPMYKNLSKLSPEGIEDAGVFYTQ